MLRGDLGRTLKGTTRVGMIGGAGLIGVGGTVTSTKGSIQVLLAIPPRGKTPSRSSARLPPSGSSYQISGYSVAIECTVPGNFTGNDTVRIETCFGNLEVRVGLAVRLDALKTWRRCRCQLCCTKRWCVGPFVFLGISGCSPTTIGPKLRTRPLQRTSPARLRGKWRA